MYWLQHDFKCNLVLISMSKVFKEKYISAYFTPNCMKKSCCYLLMIYMKNRSLKAKMDKILEAHIRCFCFLSCFWAAVAKENLFKMPAIVSLKNFKFWCDIQGSHLIGCLWVSLIIDQSECLICYFLCTELTLFCTELTLFCTELPENSIYLNQSELRNFSTHWGHEDTKSDQQLENLLIVQQILVDSILGNV